MKKIVNFLMWTFFYSFALKAMFYLYSFCMLQFYEPIPRNEAFLCLRIIFILSCALALKQKEDIFEKESFFYFKNDKKL